MSQPESIPVCRTIAAIHRQVTAARQAGKRIGVVPTMGALHEGHFSLIRAAAAETDFVVVTIFVNPTQFGPTEDLDRYPRQLEEDCQLAQREGAHAVFAPSEAEMYPPGNATYVRVRGLSDVLEGECRPGHFHGVATVVLKLCNIVGADVAYFGQKDGQQACIVRKMVDDLNVPVEIRIMPTVREPDGLAMSSRNTYMTPEERQHGLKLSQSLKLAEQLVADGERDSRTVRIRMREVLDEIGEATIDYVAVVDPDTLQAVERIDAEVMVALAVRIGQTRLIDNALIAP